MPSVSSLTQKVALPHLSGHQCQRTGGHGRCRFLAYTPERAPAPAEPDTIRPRFSVKRTAPRDEDDLKKRSLDLKDPDNLKTDTVYDPATGNYTIGTKVGDSYLNALC